MYRDEFSCRTFVLWSGGNWLCSLIVFAGPRPWRRKLIRWRLNFGLFSSSRAFGRLERVKPVGLRESTRPNTRPWPVCYRLGRFPARFAAIEPASPGVLTGTGGAGGRALADRFRPPRRGRTGTAGERPEGARREGGGRGEGCERPG